MGGGVKIELDFIWIAEYAKDYIGGANNYCDMPRLQSTIEPVAKMTSKARIVAANWYRLQKGM